MSVEDGRVTVTSTSGLTMVLEAAGEDAEGNQLWRQVGSSPRRLYEGLGLDDSARTRRP